MRGWIGGSLLCGAVLIGCGGAVTERGSQPLESRDERTASSRTPPDAGASEQPVAVGRPVDRTQAAVPAVTLAPCEQVRVCCTTVEARPELAARASACGPVLAALGTGATNERSCRDVLRRIHDYPSVPDVCAPDGRTRFAEPAASGEEADPVAELLRAFPQYGEWQPRAIVRLLGGPSHLQGVAFVLRETAREIVAITPREMTVTIDLQRHPPDPNGDIPYAMERLSPAEARAAVTEVIDQLRLYADPEYLTERTNQPSGAGIVLELPFQRLADRAYPNVALATLAHYCAVLGDGALEQRAREAIDDARFRQDLATAIVEDGLEGFIHGSGERALQTRLLLARSYRPTGLIAAYVDSMLPKLDRAIASPLPTGTPALAAIAEQRNAFDPDTRALYASREGSLALVALLDDERPTRVALEHRHEVIDFQSLGAWSLQALARAHDRELATNDEARTFVQALFGGGEYEVRIAEWRRSFQPEYRDRLLDSNRTRALADFRRELAQRAANVGQEPWALRTVIMQLLDVPELTREVIGASAHIRLDADAMTAIVLAASRLDGRAGATRVVAAILNQPTTLPNARNEADQQSAAAMLVRRFTGPDAAADAIACDVVFERVTAALRRMSVEERGRVARNVQSLDALTGSNAAAWHGAIDGAFADESLVVYLQHGVPIIGSCTTGADATAFHFAELLARERRSRARGPKRVRAPQPRAYDCAPTGRGITPRHEVEDALRARLGRPARTRPAPEPAAADTVTLALGEGSRAFASSMGRLAGRAFDQAALAALLQAEVERHPMGALIVVADTDGATVQLRARVFPLPEPPERTQTTVTDERGAFDLDGGIAAVAAQLRNRSRTTLIHTWSRR